jgi:hypothetical protein
MEKDERGQKLRNYSEPWIYVAQSNIQWISYQYHESRKSGISVITGKKPRTNFVVLFCLFFAPPDQLFNPLFLSTCHRIMCSYSRLIFKQAAPFVTKLRSKSFIELAHFMFCILRKSLKFYRIFPEFHKW